MEGLAKSGDYVRVYVTGSLATAAVWRSQLSVTGYVAFENRLVLRLRASNGGSVTESIPIEKVMRVETLERGTG